MRRNLRNEGVPVYWHKFSPKTYTVWQHAVMLVFCRRYCSSYTDFIEWLPNTQLPALIGLNAIPDEGTLCKEEKRLKPFLESVAMRLVASLLPRSFVASADMTGLQTRRASPYSVRRVKGSYSRRGFARLELVVWKRFILCWEFRLGRKDELKMVRSLWKRILRKPTTLVYDKKGDSEPFHEWLEEEGVRSIAPVRRGARKGRIRRKLMRHFPKKTYGKRNRGENVNFLFKNRYGDALSAYTVLGRRAEVATKIVAHNLWARLKTLLALGFEYDLYTGTVTLTRSFKSTLSTKDSTKTLLKEDFLGDFTLEAELPYKVMACESMEDASKSFPPVSFFLRRFCSMKRRANMFALSMF